MRNKVSEQISICKNQFSGSLLPIDRRAVASQNLFLFDAHGRRWKLEFNVRERAATAA